MTYLDEFTLSTINRKSHGAAVKGASNNFYATIYNVPPMLYDETIIAILDLNENGFFGSEEQEVLYATLKDASDDTPLGEQASSKYVMSKAQRKYVFDIEGVQSYQSGLLPSILEKKLVRLENDAFQLHYNLWIFTFEIESESASKIYTKWNNSLQYEPLFLDYQKIANRLLNRFSSEDKIRKILSYKEKRCSCLSSNENYEECCYGIFFDKNHLDDVHIWGFHYLDLLHEAQKYYETDDSVFDVLATDDIIEVLKNPQNNLERTIYSIVSDMNIPHYKFKVKDDNIMEPFFNKNNELIDITANYQNITQQVSRVCTLMVESAKERKYDNPVWIYKDTRGMVIKSAINHGGLEIHVQDEIARVALDRFITEMDSIMAVLLNPLVISPEKLSAVFEAWHPLLSRTIVDSVKQSVNLYYQNQAYIACHLLVPHIEAALRDLAVKLEDGNIPITFPSSHKTHSREYFSLGKLIDMVIGADQPWLDVEQRTGRKVAKELFHQMLTRNGGFYNIRNELSHKFENQQFGNKEFGRSLYMFILLASGFRTKFPNN